MMWQNTPGEYNYLKRITSNPNIKKNVSFAYTN